MRQNLIPHPHHASPAVQWLFVEVDRNGPCTLRLLFNLAGSIDNLLIPEWKERGRADGLWEHTCFEMFLRTPGQPSYMEFNFSPSTQSAVYGFASYRAAREEGPDRRLPRIKTRLAGPALVVIAELDDLPATDWQIGLSAVIEEVDGTKSYWALAHPPGAPDFHHPDCFALELPAPPNPSPRT